MHNDNNVLLKEKGLCGVVPTYPHKPMLLNGIRLTDYRIIYAASNAQFEQPIAEGLAARIADLTNDTLAWHADTEPATEYEILIGHTNRTATASALGGAYLATDGKRILLGGGNAYELGLAERTFLELIEQATVRGDGCVRVEPLVPIPARTCISLMSYNFYGFHAYPARMANICRVITKYLPDVISIQEPDLAMMELTHLHLDGYYAYCNGRPRHGEDEANPPADAKGANSVASILYNATRYRCVHSDTKWMSDTPDVPSKYADSVYYRHFSYVELEDLQTGAHFVVVNLHLQRAAAVRQMNVVFEHLHRLYAHLPVFLIGDFNSEADKPVLYQMREIAGFASAHDTAKKIRDRHNRIDWILYTKDCAEATFYHCCTETYPDPEDKKGYYNGRTPSDHFAFYAEVELTKQMEIRHDWSSAAQWKPAPVEE